MAETFQVTARKWRPMRFDEVVGQDHVTRTLKNAIASGRLAHAYLFTGQRGCGKTTVARLLAKAINCPNAPTNGFEPCNHCPNCIAITEGRSMDVSEIDGASNNGIDDVRSLRDNVKYPPLEGAYKVIIIDEVHMLSTSAFNALLKTLEEPPKHLVFIFATTEAHKVIPTILSRTQRYDFRRVQLDEITGRLRHIADSDGITIDDDALMIIAKKADGSMRDAQSIFDQVIAYCGMKVDTAQMQNSLNLIDADFFFDVTDAISVRSGEKAFELAHQVIYRGYDIEEFFHGLLEHFRNILTAVVTSDPRLLEVSKQYQERFLKIAKDYAEPDLLRLIRIGQTALERLKNSQQPRITLEVALVEMIFLDRAVDLESLLEEIRGLRQQGPTQAPSRAAAQPVQSAPASPKTPAKKPEENVTIDPPQDTSAPADPLTFESLQERWPAFVETIRGKRALYAVMPHVELCGLRRSTIYLSGDATTIEVFPKFKEILHEAFIDFFGTRLLFEIGKRETMLIQSGMPVLASAETAQSKSRPPKDRLEIENELLALGAKEI